MGETELPVRIQLLSISIRIHGILIIILAGIFGLLTLIFFGAIRSLEPFIRLVLIGIYPFVIILIQYSTFTFKIKHASMKFVQFYRLTSLLFIGTSIWGLIVIDDEILRKTLISIGLINWIFFYFLTIDRQSIKFFNTMNDI